MKTKIVGFLIFLAILIALVVAANGAPIPGTIVAGPMTTGDTANTFATALTFEIQGSDKQEADIAARDAISADRRTEGMTCYVIGETNLYRLVGGIANANWMLWASATNNPMSGNFLTNHDSRAITFDSTLTVSNQMTVNGTFQLLTPSVITPNALLGTDGGQDAVSYQVGPGLILSGGVVELDATNLAAVYVTNLYVTNLYSSNAYFTNLYAGNTFTTNLYATNLYSSNVFVTNLYAGDTFTTNLFTTNLYVSNIYVTNIVVNNLFATNLFSGDTYITNLFATNIYSSNVYVTNITAKNLTVQNFYSATNLLGDVTVTNGITNLLLAPNTALKADGGRQISSVANAAGMYTNDGVGNIGWSLNGENLTNLNNLSPALTNYILNLVANQNRNFYFSGTTNALGVGVSTNCFTMIDTPVSATATNSIAVPASGVYFLSRVSTNVVTRIEEGPAQLQTYVYISGGGGVQTITAHPELWIWFTNNTMVQLASSGPQLFTEGAQPVIFTTTMNVSAATNLTTGAHLLLRWFADAVANNPTWNFVIGGVYDSHISINVANQSGTYVGSFVGDGSSLTNIPNAGLQNSSVTVNGTAGEIATTSATIALGGSATLSLANPNTASTAFAGSNHVSGAGWTFSTNANNTTPDMAVPESLLSTNNAFTFLGPTHVPAAGNVSQWILIHVTNTTAVAKAITSPANCNTVGTPFVTNWTDVYVNIYGNVISNFYYIPVK